MLYVIIVQVGNRHACGVDALIRGHVRKEGISLCMRPHRVMSVCFLKGKRGSAERQREGTQSNGQMTLRQQTTAERHCGAWQTRDNSGSRTAGMEAELSGYL